MSFESPYRKAFIDSLRSPYQMPSQNLSPAQMLAPYTSAWKYISQTSPHSSNNYRSNAIQKNAWILEPQLTSDSEGFSNFLNQDKFSLSQQSNSDQSQSSTSDSTGQVVNPSRGQFNQVATSPPSPPPLPKFDTSSAEVASEVEKLKRSIAVALVEQDNVDIDPCMWTFEEKVAFYEKRIQDMKLMNEIFSGKLKKINK